MSHKPDRLTPQLAKLPKLETRSMNAKGQPKLRLPPPLHRNTGAPPQLVKRTVNRREHNVPATLRAIPSAGGIRYELELIAGGGVSAQTFHLFGRTPHQQATPGFSEALKVHQGFSRHVEPE